MRRSIDKVIDISVLNQKLQNVAVGIAVNGLTYCILLWLFEKLSDFCGYTTSRGQKM